MIGKKRQHVVHLSDVRIRIRVPQPKHDLTGFVIHCIRITPFNPQHRLTLTSLHLNRVMGGYSTRLSAPLKVHLSIIETIELTAEVLLITIKT